MRRFKLLNAVPFMAVVLLMLGSMGEFAWGEVKLAGEVKVSEPFVGVKHVQVVQKKPRARIINALVIDPKADGVRFKMTPGNGDPNGNEPGDLNYEVTRQTVREFMKQEGAVAGINAAFYVFINGTSHTNVIGLAASDGEIYSAFQKNEKDKDWPAINFGPDGKADVITSAKPNTITTEYMPRNVKIYNAISGSHMLVRNGKAKTFEKRPFNDVYHPRTAAGVTVDDKVLLVTVDGRQPDFTEGASLAELAEIMVGLGAKDAINLDGGGSTTMVMADPVMRVVNNPSDAKSNGNAGRERSNGVNIALFAKPKPGYKALSQPSKPAPPALLPYPKKKIVLDDFEGGLGRFASAVSACGSNRCVDKKSESFIVKDRNAPSGNKALGLKILRGKDNGKGLLLRFLSGGGSVKNNVVLGRVGTVGYWIKTKQVNLKASIVIDDTIMPKKNTSKAHEKGAYRPIKADGKWHFYAWDLQKVHHWSNFFNGNGALEGPNTSIDGILIVSDPKFNKQGEVIELMIDAVTYDPDGDFE
ncbi:hypothetical protein KS4_34920 [Poriferisphaera corsica]|uniref:Phosphodiester glycosidase domain-containing protein n=1 Tax=Poriferisphaera corsica TaxID=2528020 RepID=A0A517YYW4_9BACT|nr:phosphodiester glycosidase family protein [Poriferisphaera corsica]QDU35411.1 hypothetical protein KS4_34920 [Poriferisphaera corsica]